MTKSKLSKSVRKFIRLEKARIRSQFFDLAKQKELVEGLYKKFLNEPVAKEEKRIKIEPKKAEIGKAEKPKKTSAKKKIKEKSKDEKKHNKA